MKGQLELFPKIEPLILSLTLTCHKTVCPYCKMENPDSTANRSWIYNYPFKDEPLDICPQCGGKYDRENVKTVMSKDYAECERLGLKGAVRKNDKGKWEEV